MGTYVLVHGYMGTWIYGYVDTYNMVQGLMDSRIHGFKVQGYMGTDTWIHGYRYMDTWVPMHGYMWVHGYRETWVHIKLVHIYG